MRLRRADGGFLLLVVHVDDAAAGLEGSSEAPQVVGPVVEVMVGVHDQRHVARGRRQQRVAGDREQRCQVRDPRLLHPVAQRGQDHRLDIHGPDVAGRTHGPCQPQREVPGTRSDVARRLPGRKTQRLHHGVGLLPGVARRILEVGDVGVEVRRIAEAIAVAVQGRFLRRGERDDQHAERDSHGFEFIPRLEPPAAREAILADHMQPRPASVLVVAALLLAQGATAPATEEAPLPGYSPRAAQLERDTERRFRALPDAERTRAWHRYFTAEPHVATSKRNNALADYVAEQWRAAGPRGRRDPALRRAVVEPARGQGRDGRAARLRPEPARGPGPGGPRHAARGHQRRVAVVLGLGRRHGAGRVREQRQSGGLRRAAPERHRAARQDRDRPLLEPVQLSRLQGADRAARGRRRDDRLLRPGRGRLHARRGVPQGAVGPAEPPPARRHRLRLHRARAIRSRRAGRRCRARGAFRSKRRFRCPS